jgi:methylmalonyl-CoA mutase N-terminal domain/subunit
VETRQIGRLKQLKAERDGRAVDAALDRVRATASSDANIMPSLLDAVRSYATVGEISDVLRSVFGEYRERTAL